jgi:hypothetical protein
MNWINTKKSGDVMESITALFFKTLRRLKQNASTFSMKR